MFSQLGGLWAKTKNRCPQKEKIMSYNKPILRIAIVGAGLIGGSWQRSISPAGSRWLRRPKRGGRLPKIETPGINVTKGAL
jgi:hypothetical protein